VHCSNITDIVMDTATFLTELKRRKVYRVAVAYAIVAWLLIQAASILFPTFEAPPWVMKVFVTAVILGFPVALILAWAFELTPEGLRRSEEVAPRESKTRRPGSKWSAIIVTAAVLAAALLAFQFVQTRRSPAIETPKQTASTVTLDKSVAVLPFENLSSDKENAFFAQGIQDEIITTLSKISGLRVISRTSTARYNSAPENLSEIARQLRVSNMLEGSVQKVGDRVHINVQLIQADTDAHLWAQSYDRQLTDIFSVEAEVAKNIADSLQATLSPKEKARVEIKPTTNADAYVLYLRGREYQTRPDNLLQDFRSAINLYDQAIKLDPKFALAHARLAATASNIYHFYEPTETWKQKAHAEALESLRLQPNLGEGHLALGLYHYYMEGDYEAALRELGLAADALPNDGDVGLYTAAVERRRGKWTQALATYQRAEEIDPRNPVVLYDASQTYFGLRDWRTAAERMDRVLALFPDSFNVKIQRAYIEFCWKGSTAPIKAALESLPPNFDPDGVVTFARWDVSLMDRNVVAAEKALAACQLDTIASQTGVPLPKSYLQACVDLVRGDTAKARTEFEAARPSIEKIVVNSPQDGTRRAQLGLLYAFLGRKEDALREGQRAMELKPITHDVIEGAVVEDFYALTCARLGEADKAISRIERLLTTPFAVDYADESITLSDLRQRWEWDPLRKDPRFQKILAGPEPKTQYN
jgi:TolB-like protein/Tfp pilus assembly protein PilF